jgi:micrococcal nuclease
VARKTPTSAKKGTGKRPRTGTGRTKRSGTHRSKGSGTHRSKGSGTGRAKRPGTGRTQRPGTGRPGGAGGAARRQPSSLPVIALVVAALALVGVAIRVATLEPKSRSERVAAPETPTQAASPQVTPPPSLRPAQPPPPRVEDAPAPAPEAEPETEAADDDEPLDVEPQPETATTWVRGRTETVTVKRVVDGDTFETTSGRKVRLIGINTPEKKSNDPLNREATELLRSLVEGQEVTLEFDAEETDQYRRTLAYVHKGDLFVNGEIVRQGLAFCYTWEPNTSHKDEFVTWQREARDADRGLWGLPAPAPCELYVADRDGHRFHRAECGRAQRIKGRRRLEFRSRDDAFDLGQNPCGTCKP